MSQKEKHSRNSRRAMPETAGKYSMTCHGLIGNMCQYLLTKLLVREHGSWNDIVRWLFDSIWRKRTGEVIVLHKMPKGWPWDYREQSFHSPWYLCFHGQTPVTNTNSSDIFLYPLAPNRHPTVLLSVSVKEKKGFSYIHRSYTHIFLKVLKNRGCKIPALRMEVSLGKKN